MTQKPAVLFLAHRIPYPPVKGDKIRSWRMLEHLTRRYDVHLACFVDDPDDLQHAPFLEARCASASFIRLNPATAKLKSIYGLATGDPLSVKYFYSAEMARAVENIRKLPLAAEVVFSSTMAQYIEKPVEGRLRIVDFCDADSEKWLQYAENAKFPMQWIYRREGGKLAVVETHIANWADASFAVTELEARLFNSRQNISRHVDWWSNGVDTEYFDPSLPMRENGGYADVVFTGAMDYRANIEAVAFFTSEVWPGVREKIPEATFAIVGANPAKSLQALDGVNGIKVTGRVDDIRPWLGNAKCVVAPLRVARGVQNKVLEAMAMAKPVVTTMATASGLEVDYGRDLIIADTPSAMADAVSALLRDSVLRSEHGQAARARMVENYSWDARLKRFDAAFPSLDASYSSSSADVLAASA